MEHHFIKITIEGYSSEVTMCIACGGYSKGRGERLTTDCPRRRLSEAALQAIEDRLINFIDDGWVVRNLIVYEEN